MKIKTIQRLAVAFCGLAMLTSNAGAQSTNNITYQGQLLSGGAPANGSFNLSFTLYTNSTGGTAVGAVTNNNVGVTNGLFTVTFDGNPLIGDFTNPPMPWPSPSYLEIAVETNSSGAFAILTPRQQITYTPQSFYALSAGTAAIATTSTNFAGAISGDVSGTQGATVVASVGGQSAASIAQGVIAANDATPSDTANTIVARDSNGNFSAGSATLAGNLTLPDPSVIYSGANVVFLDEGSLYVGKNGQPVINSGDTLQNTGFGDEALHNEASSGNSVGNNNTAVGESALYYNSTGSNNTAIGLQALFYNTNGGYNTAEGVFALDRNTSGNNNTAIGVSALQFNTSGNENTAIGENALYDSTNGLGNTAVGNSALIGNLSGSLNSAVGFEALGNNSTGTNNIAMGYYAGQNITTGGFNIDIGNVGVTGDGNIIRIGTEGTQTNTYVAGIYGTTLPTNLPSSVVFADSSGQLGTTGTISYNQLPGDGAITINTGTGLAGGGTVFLGGAITLSATGTFSNATFSGVLNLPATGITNDYIFSGSQLMLFGDNDTNFFIGQLAGQSALSGPIGGENTGCGVGALYTIGSGSQNTADGAHALDEDTSGSANTAVGFAALSSNTSGSNNIALGALSGENITTGSSNIDIGNLGVSADTRTIRIGTAQSQTFIAGVINGDGGGLSNLKASQVTSESGFNLIIGGSANSSPTGTQNTAFGDQTFVGLSSGNFNTAIGEGSLYNNSTGSYNIGLGYQGGINITGTSNIDIGNVGVAGENNAIRIGTSQAATYLVGTVYANGVALTSDRNAKENFAAINPRQVLARVAALPVTEWNYKTDKNVEHIGPVAQDFQAAFGLNGNDDKHISVVDEGGVALAAIQGLNQKLEEQVEQKDAAIQDLNARLERLENMVSHSSGQEK